MTEQTCAERLPEHLQGRLADIRAILAGNDPDTGQPFDGDYPEDEQTERLDDMMLAGDATITVRLQMSTGGPGDEFLFDYTPGEYRPDRIRYRFLDWFDGATVTLEDDDRDMIEAAYGEWAHATAFPNYN